MLSTLPLPNLDEMKFFLLLVTFLSFMLTTEAQKKRPQKLKRTEANRANDCMMPIFELEDAADYCDSLKSINDITEIKRILKKVHSSWEDFDLYKDDCKCIEKLEDEIFLFSPEDDIEKALKTNNLPELRKLIQGISDGIDFIWLLSSDCD
jgi:hypothetical protein